MLAVTIAGTGEEEDLHVILNMAEAAIDVEIPQIADRTWHVAIDTARESPFDVVEPARQMPFTGPRYRTTAHSVVVLEARTGTGRARKSGVRTLFQSRIDNSEEVS